MTAKLNVGESDFMTSFSVSIVTATTLIGGPFFRILWYFS